MKIFSLTNFRRLTKNLNWCIALFFAILLGFGFAWNQLVGVGRGGGPTATSNLDRTVLKIDGIPVSQLEYERAVQAQGQAVAPGPPSYRPKLPPLPGLCRIQPCRSWPKSTMYR